MTNSEQQRSTTKWISVSDAVIKYGVDLEKLELLVKDGEVSHKAVSVSGRLKHYVEDTKLLYRIGSNEKINPWLEGARFLGSVVGGVAGAVSTHRLTRAQGGVETGGTYGHPVYAEENRELLIGWLRGIRSTGDFRFTAQHAFYDAMIRFLRERKGTWSGNSDTLLRLSFEWAAEDLWPLGSGTALLSGNLNWFTSGLRLHFYELAWRIRLEDARVDPIFNRMVNHSNAVVSFFAFEKAIFDACESAGGMIFESNFRLERLLAAVRVA